MFSRIKKQMIVRKAPSKKKGTTRTANGISLDSSLTSMDWLPIMQIGENPLPSSTTYDPFFASFDDGCSTYPTNNNIKKSQLSSFDPTNYQNSFASHFSPTGVPYPFYSDAATSYFSSQARQYSDYLCQPSYRTSTTNNTMNTNPISTSPTNTNNSSTNSWYQPAHCTDPRFASKIVLK